MSEEKRPDWMTSISATIDPEEYLLGRRIDKTFELSQKEKNDKIKDARIELIALDKIKLTGDPILDLERKKQALRQEFLSNPIKLKQLREKLLRGEQGTNSTSKVKESKASSLRQSVSNDVKDDSRVIASTSSTSSRLKDNKYPASHIKIHDVQPHTSESKVESQLTNRSGRVEHRHEIDLRSSKSKHQREPDRRSEEYRRKERSRSPPHHRYHDNRRDGVRNKRRYHQHPDR